MTNNIKTRILILSDTHGHAIPAREMPLQEVDVAIHCGDLTDGSKMDEYRGAIAMLKEVRAPLKLVIPGNHDFSMDELALRAKIQDAGLEAEADLVAREYGPPIELFESARAAGIVLLEEGTHEFELQNGAKLTVYASPYTPSLGAWGFQYHPDVGHTFDIKQGTDIVLTHGPPKGIMDFIYGKERAGCHHLFKAIAAAKPKIHCFGHIHEGWGARLVKWKASGTPNPTHLTAIDNQDSVSIQKLADLREMVNEDSERQTRRRECLQQQYQLKCAATSHCADDEHPLEPGKHTLFVNASIESSEAFLQRPWLVDIELPAYESMPE